MRESVSFDGRRIRDTDIIPLVYRSVNNLPLPLSGIPTAERICAAHVWRETLKRDGWHSRKGRPLSSVDIRSRVG